MGSVRTALAVGLGITVAAVAVVLAESPRIVLGTSSTSANVKLAYTSRHIGACQPGGRLPRGTDAIRLSLGTFTGPEVTVKALSGARVVTVGERGSGWAGETVTVPVREVSATIAPVTICFALNPGGDESVNVNGAHTPAATAARPGDGGVPKGQVRLEYLGAARSSWLALASSVAVHMGRGRAWSGFWIAPLVALLMLGAIALTSRAILRERDE